MFVNAHVKDVKKHKPRTFFIFPLNNTKERHDTVDKSKIIPKVLSIYEVISKSTSTYWAIL